MSYKYDLIWEGEHLFTRFNFGDNIEPYLQQVTFHVLNMIKFSFEILKITYYAPGEKHEQMGTCNRL